MPQQMEALEQTLAGSGQYSADRTLELHLDALPMQEARSAVQQALQGRAHGHGWQLTT